MFQQLMVRFLTVSLRLSVFHSLPSGTWPSALMSTFLQQKDLSISQEKKEQLKRMSDRQKWEWLQQLQMDMALSPRKDTESEKDSSTLATMKQFSSIDEQSISSSSSQALNVSSSSEAKTSPLQSPKFSNQRSSSPTSSSSSPCSSPRFSPKATTEQSAQLGSSQSGIAKGIFFSPKIQCTLCVHKAS